MPDDAQDITQKQVTLIPTDRIRILNQRWSRNFGPVDRLWLVNEGPTR